MSIVIETMIIFLSLAPWIDTGTEYFEQLYVCHVKKKGSRSFGYITNLAAFPNAEVVVAHLTNAALTSLSR